MGLRARIALGVALPILLALALLAVVRYRHERTLVEDQLRLTVLQVGQVMIGSLRHTMLLNDGDMLAQTLVDSSSIGTVQHVQIVDLGGIVRVSSRSAEVGTVRRLDDLGCIECHQYPPGSRSQTSRLLPSGEVMRVSIPIANDASCARCHAQQNTHLGVLLADISVVNIESRLLDLKKDYTTVIVTHTLRQAKRLADYVIYMYLGEVVESGPAHEVFTHPQHERTKAYLEGVF